MKKLVLAIATILVCSCGGSNKNESQGKDSVNIEETLTRNESVESEPDEPAIPDNFKIVAQYSDDNRSSAELIKWDYTVIITCKEDGSATVDQKIHETNTYRKEVGLDDAEREIEHHYEGSWQTRDVKRGTKFLTGYDIEASYFDFYFTEKFDFLYGAVPISIGPIRDIDKDKNAYYNFIDGKTSFAWKIVSFEEL